MLKTILSISGKPGLYKLVSNAKNMVIVESLSDNKKMPVYARDKVVSLGDISVYTQNEDMPLQDIFLAIYNKEQGNAVSMDKLAKNDDLKKYFGEAVPDFDRERVYPTDIKKILSWYNLLVSSKFDFNSIGNEAKAEDAENSDETKEVKA